MRTRIVAVPGTWQNGLGKKRGTIKAAEKEGQGIAASVTRR